MKKICLIFCGGTISMARNPETGFLEPAKSADELLALIPEIRPTVKLMWVLSRINKMMAEGK